jgi:hypothetical protein
MMGPMDDETLRLAIYRSFAMTGAPPDVSTYADGLARLAEQRHIALDRDGRIAMAHPFAAVPLGFSVMGSNTLWWGGCAWDSFAMPHLLTDEPSVLVATTCPGCHRALAWTVDRDAPPDGEEVAHFLTPTAHMWDDVVHTCANQRLFCNETCVDAWLARENLDRGYVIDLATLWRLAAGWYAGRLDPGYIRREPTAANDYLRSVGLQGEFWGL